MFSLAQITIQVFVSCRLDKLYFPTTLCALKKTIVLAVSLCFVGEAAIVSTAVVRITWRGSALPLHGGTARILSHDD